MIAMFYSTLLQTKNAKDKTDKQQAYAEQTITKHPLMLCLSWIFKAKGKIFDSNVVKGIEISQKTHNKQ